MAVEDSSRLLSLPQELRDEIYDHTFAECEIALSSKGGSAFPGLLLTNMQIREEGMSRLFRIATFYVAVILKSSGSGLFMLPKVQLGPEKYLKRIRHVEARLLMGWMKYSVLRSVIESTCGAMSEWDAKLKGWATEGVQEACIGAGIPLDAVVMTARIDLDGEEVVKWSNCSLHFQDLGADLMNRNMWMTLGSGPQLPALHSEKWVISFSGSRYQGEIRWSSRTFWDRM
jgi:hypothetical protein